MVTYKRDFNITSGHDAAGNRVHVFTFENGAVVVIPPSMVSRIEDIVDQCASAALDEARIFGVLNACGHGSYVENSTNVLRKAIAKSDKKNAYRTLLHGDGEESHAFASIAQPQFVWTEKSVDGPVGLTEIPTKKAIAKGDLQATIHVPQGNSPWARAIRMHELLHARFTPEVATLYKLMKLPDAVPQIAEDVRLAYHARKLGLFDDQIYFPEQGWAAEPEQPRSEIDVAMFYMAAYGQPLEGDWDKKSVPEFLARIRGHLKKDTIKYLEQWAADVDKILEAETDVAATVTALSKLTQETLVQIQSDTSKWPTMSAPFDLRFVEGPGKDGEEAKDAALKSNAATSKPGRVQGSNKIHKIPQWAKGRRWEWPDRAPPPPTREVADNYTLDPIKEADWGEMTVQLAPLERNFKALVKRTGAAAPEGPTPRHLHRWYGDKHVFMRQGMRRGGTLLIDISGSMNWAWEDTLKLIEATPAMTIAMYSGDGTKGVLTIIAKDGRLVGKDFHPREYGHYGENTVDGPALSWLARQPRPRVWFSDGDVIPRNGSSCGLARNDAERLCRLGAIKRTQRVNEVATAFGGRPMKQED